MRAFFFDTVDMRAFKGVLASATLEDMPLQAGRRANVEVLEATTTLRAGRPTMPLRAEVADLITQGDRTCTAERWTAKEAIFTF